MKAMVLAAGLGTRLRPLTNDRPKALVEVNGRTLLEITLARLRAFGIREVIVNAHHFAEKMIEYLAAHDNFDMRIEVSREDDLLDTGGGIKKAAWFFTESDTDREEPFLVHNVDVLSTIDFGRMVEFHTELGALATLAVQDRMTSRPLLFDERGLLRGRAPKRDDAAEMTSRHPTFASLAFCGIHILSPRIFEAMQEEGAFSIIDTYVRLAAERETIAGFRADDYYWRDLGKPDHILQAEHDLRTGIYPGTEANPAAQR
ncbi:MAG TPA: nucleotidyltransferase family protein [Terracidiphilus sp.]|nr:nucleotidyltransferase family protein [Terracidiphilus sp.]